MAGKTALELAEEQEKKDKMALDKDPSNEALKNKYNTSKQASADARQEALNNRNLVTKGIGKFNSGLKAVNNFMKGEDNSKSVGAYIDSEGNMVSNPNEMRLEKIEDQDTPDTTQSDTGTQNTTKTRQPANTRQGLSASFYRNLSANLHNKPTGNLLDAQAATHKEQAQNYKNRSADRQMESQASQQIANRNEYSEAGKVASMQNNAQNMQNINNLSAAAGNAAALQRKITAPDVQSQQARQDQQRNVANMQREKANTAQEESTGSYGLSDELETRSRDYDRDLDEKQRLSMGEGIGSEETTRKDSTSDKNTSENIAEDTTEDRPTNTPGSKITGNPHHILNYVTYGDPKSMDDADRKLYEAWGSPQPLDEATIKAANGNKGILQQNVMSMRPDFWRRYAESDIGKSRGVGTANQRNIGNGLTRDELDNATQTVEQQKPTDPPSDARVKDLKTCLSDLHLKHIKEDFDSGIGISPENFAWLAKYLGGKFKHNDREYDFFNDNDWADDTDGSVLQGYAEHIRNYLYTYKPEATEIDSSIDPNQEHIGPMAQDIEQVNPACIKETPEGVKTVDTQRLSMMNAGAIGDLARMLSDISDRLTKAGI